MDPFTILSALGSIASGVVGAFSSAGKAASAKLAEKTQLQGIQYDLQSAIDAGKLELASAGLDIKASIASADAISAQTGSAIFDSLLSGEISARDFESKAWADEFNAKVSDQLASAAVSKASADATDFRRQQGARLAENRAAQAASGLTSDGSPMLVDRSIMSEIEIGSARLRYAGDVEFFKQLTEGELLRYQSANETASAKLARQAATINANYAKQAGDIARTAALMGVDTANLKSQAALLDINTAVNKAKINRQTVKIGTQAAVTSAGFEGASSLLGGFTQAASSIAASGKFG